MSESKGLPRGWAEATLGDLITLTQNGFGKRSQESGRPTVVLRLADIADGEISLADPRRVNANPEQIQQYGLKPDDLLAIRVNGSPDIVGRVVRFLGSDQPVLFCDHFIHLRLPESGLARYLRCFADTRTVRRFVEENKVSSAGQNTVNQSTLMRLAVPVPPLSEQHRIVEKIEELFSDLDAGVASLQRAKANLKRYRASVLKSAVEGRLTEDWRKEHPQAEDGQMLLDRILRERREKWEKDQLQKFKEKGKEPPKNWQSKYEEPTAPDTSELPELPEGWVWARLGEILRIRNGYAFSSADYQDDGIPLIRQSELKGPTVTLDDTVCLPESFLEEHSDFCVRKGDILVGMSGSLGAIAEYQGETPCLQNQRTGLFVIADGVSRGFCRYAYLSFTARIVREGKGVGVQNVSAKDIESLPIPLPPLAEQEQVVALVEERLSQIDSAERTIDAELIRSKRLRQSVLKRAFEGKLVPQDPKDEPASVLLERIKASKEAKQPKKVKAGTK
jgi:type I restriction enzyme S subunit